MSSRFGVAAAAVVDTDNLSVLAMHRWKTAIDAAERNRQRRRRMA
jgi:hypothetical protein